MKKSISALHSRERERSQCSNQSRGLRASSQNPLSAAKVHNHCQSFTDFELQAPLRNVKLTLAAEDEAKFWTSATARKNPRATVSIQDPGLISSRKTPSRNNLIADLDAQPHTLRNEASVEKIQHIEFKSKVHHTRAEASYYLRPEEN